MQIVIEIPEEYYDALHKTEILINKGRRNGKTLESVIYSAVAKGMPLPAKHGRLIDADDLIKRTKKFIDVPNKYISQRNKDFIYYLEREETIIQADMEEGE